MKLIKFFPIFFFHFVCLCQIALGFPRDFFLSFSRGLKLTFGKKKCAHNFAALLDSLLGRVDELAGGDSPRLYLASDGINN